MEGGRAGEVVKKGDGERNRDRGGGSYVVVYRVAENGNLAQGRVLYENLV